MAKKQKGTARNYARGAAREHAAGRRLVAMREEADNWHYVRTSGSHSPTDVVRVYRYMTLLFWDGVDPQVWVAEGDSEDVSPQLSWLENDILNNHIQLKPTMAAAKRAAEDWASGKTWAELLARRRKSKVWRKALAREGK